MQRLYSSHSSSSGRQLAIIEAGPTSGGAGDGLAGLFFRTQQC